MNRTIVGRITLLRGARYQIQTFLRQATELGPWAPVAIPFLLYVFGKSYQDEQKRMQEERVQPLKREREMFGKVERQLVREIADKRGTRRGLWRLIPRRVRQERA